MFNNIIENESQFHLFNESKLMAFIFLIYVVDNEFHFHNCLHTL